MRCSIFARRRRPADSKGGEPTECVQHYGYWNGLRQSFIKDAVMSLISTLSKVLRRSPIQQLEPALQAKDRIGPQGRLKRPSRDRLIRRL